MCIAIRMLKLWYNSYLTNHKQICSPLLSWFVVYKTQDSKTIKHSQYGNGDVCNKTSNSNIEIKVQT